MNLNITRPVTLLIAALAIASCKPDVAQAPAERSTNAEKPYVIGLGEIMGLTQMRHEKLWFAGKAGNWPLAAYELDEIKEGFDDAIAFHNRHKSVPDQLKTMVPEYVGQPLDALDAAVKAKDQARFTIAFDNLTQGCNACHKAADFGFNVVQRPTTPPYSNQRFEITPAN